MDRKSAEELYAACERAVADLTVAEQAIRRIDDPVERASLMRALGLAIAEVLGSLRGPVVRQYPDLEPPVELGAPATDLSESELAQVARLASEDIELLEQALMAECAPSWRKVARVIGAAAGSLKGKHRSLPIGYLAQRVAALVSTGRLESQGSLGQIRFSEVRLPPGGSSVA